MAPYIDDVCTMIYYYNYIYNYIYVYLIMAPYIE